MSQTRASSSQRKDNNSAKKSGKKERGNPRFFLPQEKNITQLPQKDLQNSSRKGKITQQGEKSAQKRIRESKKEREWDLNLPSKEADN